jgi:hypothetical protein
LLKKYADFSLFRGKRSIFATLNGKRAPQSPCIGGEVRKTPLIPLHRGRGWGGEVRV